MLACELLKRKLTETDETLRITSTTVRTMEAFQVDLRTLLSKRVPSNSKVSSSLKGFISPVRNSPIIPVGPPPFGPPTFPPSHQTKEARLAALRQEIAMLRAAVEAWGEEVGRCLFVSPSCCCSTLPPGVGGEDCSKYHTNARAQHTCVHQYTHEWARAHPTRVHKK